MTPEVPREIVRPIVLAAGLGKRMRSTQPKVLHPVAGRPMIRHVLRTLAALGLPRPVVVVGHGAEAVEAAVGEDGRCVLQPEPRGTGDAVRAALEQAAADLAEARAALVLYGDMPLLRAETLERLIAAHAESGGLVMLTGHPADPTGYGRVLRDAAGQVTGVVEEADATPAERAVREVNAGVYVVDLALLREAVTALRPQNAQGEYYLTDMVGWAVRRGVRPRAVVAENPEELLGVNSRRELARVEAAFRARLLDRLMDAGVTVIDPAHTYVHVDVTVGPDTVLHPGTSLEGTTRVGSGCVIGPQARLVDAEIGDRVTVVASTITRASVGEGSRVGPYAHLRPGTRVGRYVEIGNYAEMKNATVGDYTKVHHHSYLGDATVGQRVNIGAGTVTCNLRDRSGQKWPTVIEDEAFIGSDTMLVAPVRVGRGASTGAGSVVTRDVPAGALAVGVPARVIRRGAEAPR